jgi:hypothetical protein
MEMDVSAELLSAITEHRRPTDTAYNTIQIPLTLNLYLGSDFQKQDVQTLQ